MILEVATFETAFAEAKAIVASMRGFLTLELLRCLEARNRFALLVRWERIEDHTEGFRKSAEYRRWRALLHHFYDPFPEVAHYEPVIEA
jgi:heme-degrading monooxygenase HmoA